MEGRRPMSITSKKVLFDFLVNLTSIAVQADTPPKSNAQHPVRRVITSRFKT